MFYEIVLSALICHFCEKKMNYSSHCIGSKIYICTTICKHTGNSGLLENYEVILAKFSSSCYYMLSFSFFFVVFIFRKVGQIV